MLSSATYVARPHTKARNHKIPIEAIKKVTGQRDHSALDGKNCFFEIFVKSKAEKVNPIPPLVLRPSSGGEVNVGKTACPEFPDVFAIDEYLIVRLTIIE